jgi:hypothetical protein
VMSRRLTQRMTVAATALLGVALLGVGSASAGTPAGWNMTVEPTPAAVSPDQDAGYSITITNSGPSNISQLYLVANDAGNPPTFVSTSQGTCTTDGGLFCNFGALNANGTPISVVVAYSTAGATGSSFSVTFELNTTGATYVNAKGSHGTVYAVTGTTGFATGDSGGAFVVDDAIVANDQRLGPTNHQSTLVVSPASYIPVTVQDNASGGDCPTTGRLVGECSLVSVGAGHLFAAPFKVVITILGSSLPSAVNTNNLYVVHTYTVLNADGTTTLATETITARCSVEPPSAAQAPCIVVTKVGKNLQIDIWLLRNGGLHSAY